MHLQRDMSPNATDATADTPNTPQPAFAEEPTPTLIFESPVIVTVPSGPAAAPGFGCPAMVCKDYMNECGKRYGGCYDMCKGEVSFPVPGCPPESEIITPSSGA
ncbi:Peptidase M43 pregnancy-associated plasma-A [Macrophomina phaseolina MS6]|uniref:Peptidase M43 pregnancy-associated plasma-A n=1 Tax=Macrophomina phaseolina (strain MS6) TaxID=1126212 RepID=K2R8L4_MACPH|nr:Peptidase M43 pregnancy-associated plasma-A [Macrophomina phaseolina MS6]